MGPNHYENPTNVLWASASELLKFKKKLITDNGK